MRTKKKKERLYLLSLVYEGPDAQEEELLGVVYAIDDGRPVYLSARSDREQIHELLHRGAALIVPAMEDALSLYRLTEEEGDDDIAQDRVVHRTEAIRERGPRLGYAPGVRGCALMMGIASPRAVSRERQYFTAPAPNGERHQPEDDCLKWGIVVRYTSALLETMRAVDLCLVREEEDYYRVTETGTLGSMSGRGFAYEREQTLLGVLARSRRAGVPLRSGVRVRRDLLTTAGRMRDHIRVSRSAERFIECPVAGSLDEGDRPLHELVDVSGRGYHFYRIALPAVPEPGAQWMATLMRLIRSLVETVTRRRTRGSETATRTLRGLTLSVTTEGAPGREGNRLEIRVQGYFPITYHHVTIPGAGEPLRAEYLSRGDKSVAMTQPLTEEELRWRLVNTYKYIELLRMIERLEGTGRYVLYDVTEGTSPALTDLYLYSDGWYRQERRLEEEGITYERLDKEEAEQSE